MPQERNLPKLQPAVKKSLATAIGSRVMKKSCVLPMIQMMGCWKEALSQKIREMNCWLMYPSSSSQPVGLSSNQVYQQATGVV